jgi:hypothetical protein
VGRVADRHRHVQGARDFHVVNCAIQSGPRRYYFKEPSVKEREAAVWADLDRAFSTPVTPNDRGAEYTPTRVVVELFKQAGLDEIYYRSSLGKGLNVATFDLDSVELVTCGLLEAASIKFTFKISGNMYQVQRKNKKRNDGG